ncbi:MAG: sensor histidine kinase [Oscillospiraceae bacterium]
MKFKDYLKDRLPAYLIYGSAWVMILIFMTAFHISIQPKIYVSVIFLLALSGAESWDFLRKKRDYDKLLLSLEKLDRKYLISEMIDPPEFYDGRLLYEALRESNKSMCEHIAEYRRENTQFREYIELWVHEIKLPVSALGLMCHNDNADKYSAQLKRIDDYIENVLYYARSTNAEKDYIIKETSLRRVFANAAMKNREQLQQLGFTVTAENLDISVMTDGKWLGFIFGQLMDNSMKYSRTDRSPEITVFAEQSPEQTTLHFRDNGIGIEPKDLPFIFEKSFTGENGRSGAKSTGMGLYLVARLCEKLGHRVFAQSEKGEYTEIIISFGSNDFYKIN